MVLDTKPVNRRGGTRTIPTSSPDTPISATESAECVADSDETRPMVHSDPALNELIQAWPTLSGWTRWQIQELIESQIQSNTQTGIERGEGLD
ncbi:MAG: hypothetical protein P1U42_07450 [Phycisphaerales bacterium]|nr:hypothetical protein [Phycisphaerales bacterium]